MDYPKLNVDLLDRTIAEIKEAEKTRLEAIANGTRLKKAKIWVQNVWRVVYHDEDVVRGVKVACGTGMCCAGWAVHIDGARYKGDGDYVASNAADRAWLAKRQEVPATSIGSTIDVSERAQRVLGLTDFEAGVLFSATNSLSRLELVAEEIKAGIFRTAYYDTQEI